MQSDIPSALGIIAGKGVYPLLLAQSARRQGVSRIHVVAFRGETERSIEKHADTVDWLYLGQLDRLLESFKASRVRHAVMAGQITPTSLFRVRMDARALALIRRLAHRNAHTIFGAIGDELRALDIDLMPASAFMEAHMPAAGVLTARPPTAAEQADIALGQKVAHVTSRFEIGQTVVIKEGTVLAVEAFEGTDKAILRAGELGGPGCVVVKVAKQGHDMRFDIPVIGMHTLKTLKKVKAGALALEAGRAIMLEKEQVIADANRLGLSIIALPPMAE